MCGVVGFSGSPTAESKYLFMRLCRESTIRGEHAFGFAYINDGEMVVKKSRNLDELLAELPERLPSKIIFHNRYSTSGDADNMENNQPIVIDGSALVFNGTIDMGTKEEMSARSGYDLLTDNDGEIILRDVINGFTFDRLLDSKKTFAGIYLGSSGEMFAFRNELRPLHALWSPDGEFISSTKDIALRAGFGIEAIKELEPYTRHLL